MAPESITAPNTRALPPKSARTGQLNPAELAELVELQAPRGKNGPDAPAPLTGDVDNVDRDLARRGDKAGKRDHGEMPWEAKPKAEDADTDMGDDNALAWEHIDQKAARARRPEASEQTQKQDQAKVDDLRDRADQLDDRNDRMQQRIKQLRRRGKKSRVRELRSRVDARRETANEADQKAGKIRRSLKVESADGQKRAIDQFFKTSCAAVEGMAAWAKKDGPGYDAALQSLKTQGACRLPNGETLTLSTATRAEVMETLKKNASPDAVGQALMQAALMKHVNPNWEVDSTEGLKAADVRQMAGLMNTGLFMPQALVNGQPMTQAQIKDQLGHMLKQYDSVSMIVGKGAMQHAVSVEKVDGKYQLYEGNQPIVNDKGKAMRFDLHEIQDMLASGELNAGGYRVRLAAAPGSGQV